MVSTTALGIICKTPHPGMSKTRLKGVFDGAEAAGLSGAFIRDVAGAIEAVPPSVRAKGYAVYAPAGSEAALRSILPASFGLLLQADRDFGVVLRSAAQALLAMGHDAAILINSDSPTLPASCLVRAVAALRAEGDRVVLGPAIDGGYYLIGLKRAHAALFTEIPWSTAEVLSRTLEQATAIDCPATLLPTWYDVDDAESFALLQAELAGHAPPFAQPGLVGGPAPATRAYLTEWADRRFSRLAPTAAASA